MSSSPSDRPVGIEAAAADAVARGYESRDVNIRAVVAIFVGFGVLFAGLLGALAWFYNHETGKPPAWQSPRSVVDRSALASDAPPLQPQQGHDALDAWDLAKMRQNEDSVFDSLGWTRDAKTHRYVVPAAVLAKLQRRSTPTPVSPPTTRPQSGGT